MPCHLTTFQAIVLGVVQGLTEFAPVSSSGHLILVPWLFHWCIATTSNETLNKTFDVALHMGTFVGAVVYFWRDIVKYLGAWFRSIGDRAAIYVDPAEGKVPVRHLDGLSAPIGDARDGGLVTAAAVEVAGLP